jgi:hypothetical protein
MRENEGVYLLGKRKLFIKCEKENLQVRVGGGFLKISQFVDKLISQMPLSSSRHATQRSTSPSTRDSHETSPDAVVNASMLTEME